MGDLASYPEPGVVSLWVGVTKPDLDALRGVDFLKDMCGVDYYDLDFQEVILTPDRCRSSQPVAELLRRLSYSASFLPAATRAAAERGIDLVYWAVAQYDFAYHPERVRGEVWPDPLFLGMFPWQDEHR
jgi:hypothetical protein